MKGKEAKNRSYKTVASPSSVGLSKGRETFGSGPQVPARGSEISGAFSKEANYVGDDRSAKEAPIQSNEKTEAPSSGDSSVSSQTPDVTDEPRFNDYRWLARNGHSLTYVGIFLFTLVLYFRPYELIPALSGFHSIALIIAVATLIVYLPSQFTAEGTLTALPTEVKCILFIAAWALLTVPIAKDPRLALETFNDTFIKVVLIFVIMVNVLRTERRLKGLMWLGIGVGIMLSYQALDLYQKGEFKTEGYRVSVDFGGMFGNPNDMSIHLVIFIPIAIAMGAAAGHKLVKIAYFGCAAVMTAGSFVTQSRGAFLGLVAVAAVLVWKLGRRQRFKAVIVAAIVGLVVILLAPGNYGLRILSIFIPSLDPVGSSGQRTDLLIRSIVVTLRNPQGIGIGNFQIVGSHNLGTHNGFTQVSSELGLLAFAAYLILLISPLRKLNLIERQIFDKGELSWIYYLSIGIQASIAGFMAASFFSSVAYHWYVYYPIAYAIGIRRIYQLGDKETGKAAEGINMGELETQRA